MHRFSSLPLCRCTVAECALTESYADDFNLSESLPDIDSLGRNLTEHLKLVSEWAEIAPSKSTVTLFTPDKHQSNFHPQVYIGNTLLPLAKVVKHLGLNLCTHFVTSPHLKINKTKLSGCLRLMKAASGQSWGDKETLRLT
jgi:hypothetical protein